MRFQWTLAVYFVFAVASAANAQVKLYKEKPYVEKGRLVFHDKTIFLRGVACNAVLQGEVREKTFKEDLARMRKFGFNAVAFEVPWNDSTQPAKDKLSKEFLGRLSDLIDDAGDQGIWTILCFRPEQPSWVDRHFRIFGARYPVLDLCLSHAVRKLYVDFVGATVQQLASRRKKRIVLYDVLAMDRPRGLDVGPVLREIDHPLVQGEIRKWLLRKYGDEEAATKAAGLDKGALTEGRRIDATEIIAREVRSMLAFEVVECARLAREHVHSGDEDAVVMAAPAIPSVPVVSAKSWLWEIVLGDRPIWTDQDVVGIRCFGAPPVEWFRFLRAMAPSSRPCLMAGFGYWDDPLDTRKLWQSCLLEARNPVWIGCVGYEFRAARRERTPTFVPFFSSVGNSLIDAETCRRLTAPPASEKVPEIDTTVLVDTRSFPSRQEAVAAAYRVFLSCHRGRNVEVIPKGTKPSSQEVITVPEKVLPDRFQVWLDSSKGIQRRGLRIVPGSGSIPVMGSVGGRICFKLYGDATVFDVVIGRSKRPYDVKVKICYFDAGAFVFHIEGCGVGGKVIASKPVIPQQSAQWREVTLGLDGILLDDLISGGDFRVVVPRGRVLVSRVELHASATDEKADGKQ